VSDVRFEPSGKDSFRVNGALTFATARDALLLSQSVFGEPTDLNIDLSGVTNADSAGLAVLIEWYLLANRANKAIHFVGVPVQLRALAKISDVDELLAFPESAGV
jgi:phospholipid transport system transporter-binding protein